MLLVNSPPVTPSVASSTMSLAILPSTPMIYGQNATTATTTLLPPTPPSNKKPKLSLNTTSLPTSFSKGSTSLRLETLSATSPTVRNTFCNAHPVLQGDKPLVRQRPKLSPLATDLPSSTRLPTPLRTDAALSPSSEHSTTSSSCASSASISTVDSLSAVLPYKLPFNACSILKNSPLPRRVSHAQRQPMFPAAKSVSFRAPLAEDIHTSKYTMRHSDIESSTSTISTLELPPPAHGTNAGEEQPAEKAGEETATREDARSPQLGEKRESSDEDDSDACPATPVAGRRKRHRLWQWTLSPVESEGPQETPVAEGDGSKVAGDDVRKDESREHHS